MHLRHLEVRAFFHHIRLIFREAKKTNTFHLCIQYGIVGITTTTLTGVQHLRSMVTGAGNITLRKHALAFITHTHRVACIVDNLQIMLLGYRFNRLDIAGITKHMHRHDSHSLIGDSSFNGSRIDIQRLGVDVCIHRCASFVHNSTRRRDERERRGDYLAF